MPAKFQLLAAHPALDFVNTLDNRFVASGPIELLCSYSDLLLFMEQADVLDVRKISALRKRGGSARAVEALRRAQDLREVLASLFYEISDTNRRPSPAALKSLEWYFVDAQKHQELVWKRHASVAGATARAMWEWGRFESDLMLPVWAIAQSAAALLTSDAMNHVHACHSEACRWLFLDTSKNHSRRWCDMKLCGNRMKARRFQASH
jgi:predicted RNA-binding Zn ribbon-like protein